MAIPKIINTFASNLYEITMDDLKRLKDIQQQTEPYIVKSHDIHIDADFADWIADIKSSYRSAQVKAAVKVNAEKFLFNWQLWPDLMLKKAEERWGAGVVEQVSLDLKREFHDAQGVSTSNLYKHQGKMVNKVVDHLPALQSKLVQEVLKENYDFGFATAGHEIYDEAELEEVLTKNVTDILLELGTGFAFLGRQKELVVGGRSRKIDLLFYHICLRCYIVCELKAKPFEPEFAGKLNYYMNAVDELLKTDVENPTIGLLVCSDMDKTDVQWSFGGISTPMGVATYNNIRIKDALPSQELLAERVCLLQKELQETKRMINKKPKKRTTLSPIWTHHTRSFRGRYSRVVCERM